MCIMVGISYRQLVVRPVYASRIPSNTACKELDVKVRDKFRYVIPVSVQQTTQNSPSDSGSGSKARVSVTIPQKLQSLLVKKTQSGKYANESCSKRHLSSD